MTADPHDAVTDLACGFEARCMVMHRTDTAEFIDLLLADDEWVADEFDAIVGAGWGGVPPPCPAPRQGTHWPRRPGCDDRPTPARPPHAQPKGGDRPAHQRGPPNRSQPAGRPARTSRQRLLDPSVEEAPHISAMPRLPDGRQAHLCPTKQLPDEATVRRSNVKTVVGRLEATTLVELDRRLLVFLGVGA